MHVVTVKFTSCLLLQNPLLLLHLSPAMHPILNCYSPSIPHKHTSFSPHLHWNAPQADNKCNLSSAETDRLTQICQSAAFADNQHLSLCPLTPPCIPHSLFLRLFRPHWNALLMKINDSSQLPYPPPICFLCSYGGEFPWNFLIPLSVLPDRFTASFFFCSQWRQQRTIQALLEKLVSFEKLNYSSSHFYYKGNEVKLCNSDMVQMADRKPIRCETDSACDSFILQKATIFGNAPRLVIRVRKWWENWTHSHDYIKLTQWI